MDENNKEKKNNLKINLANRMNMEAISWKKVREKYLKDGDKNFKYFHCLANHRRSYNYVVDLHVNRHTVSGNNELRDAASSFLQNLYHEDFTYRPKLDSLHFNKILDFDRLALEDAFTENEITTCLKDCNRDC